MEQVGAEGGQALDWEGALRQGSGLGVGRVGAQLQGVAALLEVGGLQAGPAAHPRQLEEVVHPQAGVVVESPLR